MTMDESFFIRLDELELRLRRLQRDVQELRADAVAVQPPPTRVAPPAPTPRTAATRESVAPPPQWKAPRDFELPSFDVRERLAQVDLLGAQALAWAGGIVTILGVVFFFILAVNRGWIGPELRVALGGAASVLVFTGGVWLRRRYEETFASLAAVGAGIAGAYATLAAATVLYDFVPHAGALVAAAAIAAAAVAVALRWRSELLAGLGLVGSILAPALLALQGGLTAEGTAFAAVVYAGAIAVAARPRWTRLLVVATVAGALQIVALLVDVVGASVTVVAVAAAFWLLFLAVAVVFQLVHGRDRVGALPSTYALASGGFAFLAVALLYDGGRARGSSLFAAAVVYAGVAIGLRRRARDFGVLVGALALTLAAVATANVLSGPVLAYTFAGEAALLAFLGLRLRETRFQLASLAYLALGLVHALAFEARPDHLFVAQRHPARGALAVVAVAVAAAVYARVARDWSESELEQGMLRPLGAAVAWLREHRREWNGGVAVAAGVAAVYAASLGILQLFESVWPGGGVRDAFERGHVAVTALWAILGVAALEVAIRRSRAALLVAAAWIGVTLLKVVVYEGHHVSSTHRAYSFIAAGAAAFAAMLIVGIRARRDDETAALTLIGWFASLALFVSAGTTLASGTWIGASVDGFAVLAAAAVYGIASVAVARAQRDLATLLWGTALSVLGPAEWMLLDGTWLVLAGAGTAAATALVARLAREDRLRFAAGAYALATAGVALVLDAPPRDFFVAQLHPASGVPALVLAAAAAAIVGALATEHELDVRGRAVAFWIGGVLAVYAASLAIIAAVERVSTTDLHTEFQRGHTAVSAFWGALGLLLLYAGLKRAHAALRVAGFALFGVSLGKIFLYDLPTLSSITRALSFLAVGAVCLVGGFFYQRLTAERRGRPS